jgi:hypothetical protein
MTAALSPELAIAYVRELSADVRAAVVLARNGAVLAGEPGLAPAAMAFAAALDPATDAVIRTPDGVVFGARSRDHSLLVVASSLSLEGPTRLDSWAAVNAMTDAEIGPERPESAPSAALEQAAKAAIEAVNGP